VGEWKQKKREIKKKEEEKRGVMRRSRERNREDVLISG